MAGAETRLWRASKFLAPPGRPASPPMQYSLLATAITIAHRIAMRYNLTNQLIKRMHSWPPLSPKQDWARAAGPTRAGRPFWRRLFENFRARVLLELAPMPLPAPPA